MRVGLAAMVPLFLLSSVFAQTSSTLPITTIERDPQALAILQQSLTAQGATANGVPSSIVATGTYTQYAGDGSAVSYAVKLEALGTDKFRRSLSLADGTHTGIARGGAGWSLSASGSADGLSLSRLAGNRHEDLPVLAIAQAFNSANVQVVAAGIATIGGTSLLQVSVQPTGLSADPRLEAAFEATSNYELYFDPQTYLPVHVRYYVHPTDWRLAFPVDLVLSDFRAVSGVLLPFSVARSMNGQQLSTTQWQSISLNLSIPDSDFNVGVTQ